MATDKILKSLEQSIDSYVEIYIGKYGRPKLNGKNASITLHNLSEAGASRMIIAAVKYLQKTLNSPDTDLMNIRDEIIGDLNQLLYLFTLK